LSGHCGILMLFILVIEDAALRLECRECSSSFESL